MSATPSHPSTTHLERTAQEPRDASLHKVILSHITQVNPTIRLLRLTPVSGQRINFLPGQWVDLFILSLPKPGGFTLTSKPSSSYLELAVQATSNPPAAWLSQPTRSILNSELQVRVGGSFVWPPAHLRTSENNMSGIDRVVFVAGGVGINPLISMLSALLETEWRGSLVFLYSTKKPASGDILFLERLAGLLDETLEECGIHPELRLFLTNEESGVEELNEREIPFVGNRLGEGDLQGALGKEGREKTFCYVCGPPGMTDEVVGILQRAEGMKKENVLSEKWW